MEKEEKLRIFAGILLIISCFTHIIQVFFVGTATHTVIAVMFGVAYGIIGIILIYLKDNKIITLLCAVLPTIGGILGVYRYFVHLPNPFSVFHVIIDIIVVPICIYLYYKMRKNE